MEGLRVLSLEELLDASCFDEDDTRPVWFENRGLFCCAALLQCGVAERERGNVRIEWHGTFGGNSFEMAQYGKWWRVWTGKPSAERMDATAWDGEMTRK